MPILALSKKEIPVLIVEVCALLAIIDNSAGPALEPPAHLGIFRRVAYYTFHRRFRDFFVPYFTLGLGHATFQLLKGAIPKRDLPGALWVNGLILLSGSWVFSFYLTRWEAIQYSNRPCNEEEEKLWTKGMTRREFLERNRG